MVPYTFTSDQLYLARWVRGEHQERLMFALWPFMVWCLPHWIKHTKKNWSNQRYTSSEGFHRRDGTFQLREDLDQLLGLAFAEALDKFDFDRVTTDDPRTLFVSFLRLRIQCLVENFRRAEKKVVDQLPELEGSTELGLRPKPLPRQVATNCVSCHRSFEEVSNDALGLCETCNVRRRRMTSRFDTKGVCPRCAVVLYNHQGFPWCPTCGFDPQHPRNYD